MQNSKDLPVVKQRLTVEQVFRLRYPIDTMAVFRKVKAVIGGTANYAHFVNCLKLYQERRITGIQLIILVEPYLGKYEIVLNELREMFNVAGPRPMVPPIPMKKDNEWNYFAPDYSKCKKVGAHYVALEKMNFPPICTGFGRLERVVINDTFKLIPNTDAEKSATYGNPKRSEFEEAVYKCDDERYEMDMLIEANKATKRLFKSHMKKLVEMKDKKQTFTLDENLGGSCLPIYKTELDELFSDCPEVVIAGIRERPEDAIPMVLEKLQEHKYGLCKHKEGFLPVWSEKMNQNYLQSLDTFGPTFKRKEEQDLRPKRFLTEIDMLLSESNKHLASPTGAGTSSSMSLKYSRNILDDAYQLLLYQIKRTGRSNSNGQTGQDSQENERMALFLKDFMAFVFQHQVQEFVDDEGSSDSDKGSEDEMSENSDNEQGEGEADESQPEPVDISDDIEPQQLNLITANKTTEPIYASVFLPGNSGARNATSSRHDELNGNATNSNTDMNDEDDVVDLEAEYQGEWLGGLRLLATAAAMQIHPINDNAEEAEVDMFEEHTTNVSASCSSWTESALTEKNNRDGGDVRNVGDDYVLFFASKSWYCFLRLHHLLCERLHKILELANELIDDELKHGTYDPSNPESVHAVYLELKEGKTLDEIKAYYPDFLQLVVDFMKGDIEAENYEDALRRMFGSQAYVAYTLDQVISRALRHLQTLVSDPVNEECVILFYEFVGKLDSSPQNRVGYEMEYKEKAEKLLVNECVQVVFLKNQLLMTLELLEGKTPPELEAMEAMDE